MLIIGFIIVVYITGICCYVSCKTVERTKLHDNGFLGLGYTTCSHKEVTPKIMRMSLLWPILSMFWFTKAIIWILNDLLSFVLLIFGYRYRESRLFKFIDTKFG